MAAVLSQQEMDMPAEASVKNSNNSMPPLVRALFQDISNIRLTTLTQSPELLPVLAPALIEAEVHIRQLWSAQV